jgi:type I restriction enzyme S subunit
VVQDQFNDLAAGSVVKNISGDLVKKVILSLPPIEVQISLASILDSVSTDIERVEVTYAKKIADIDALRQSLLQKAFAGELT